MEDKFTANFFEKILTNKTERVESRDNLVILTGFAKWSEDSLEEDHAIWVASIENDKVSKWQIYEDTKEKRIMLNIY
ncbi:MAG: hypothetical protein ACFFA3_05615 [Promethearchaeota archaeon]